MLNILSKTMEDNGNNEHNEDIYEFTEREELEEILRTDIINALNGGYPFRYIWKLCKMYHVNFNDKIINYMLDLYSKYKRQDTSDFMCKYITMYKTGQKILFE